MTNLQNGAINTNHASALPSPRFRKSSLTLIILFKTHLVLSVKFLIDSLAYPFLYCSCDLCLYNWHLLGPMFPIALNYIACILPCHLVNRMIGWMSACGARGSYLPFMTGMIAALGIRSLQPLCVFQQPQCLFSDIHSFFVEF